MADPSLSPPADVTGVEEKLEQLALAPSKIEKGSTPATVTATQTASTVPIHTAPSTHQQAEDGGFVPGEELFYSQNKDSLNFKDNVTYVGSENGKALVCWSGDSRKKAFPVEFSQIKKAEKSRRKRTARKGKY